LTTAGASREPDTIAAVATAAGRAGIGVVRISGPKVPSIAAAMLGSLPAPRIATLRSFKGAQGEVLDSGLALFFAEPASFTGEDLLELHGHGGPVVLDRILQRALALGARLAEPGEFSRRAFLNDKIDLVEAEAIADLIDSATDAAARAAVRSLQGEFSLRIHALVEGITTARMHVEAAIDFPDEDIDFLDDTTLRSRVARLVEAVAELEGAARQGALLREGIRIVIAGKPNAGKSSLLNRLAGHEAAIVTPIAGTTRDPLREQIHLDGMPLHLIDTAGLRDSPDLIEAEGIRRARSEMSRADRILYLVDATDLPDSAMLAQELAGLPAQIPVTLVLNKVDVRSTHSPVTHEAGPVLRISALTGEGLGELRDHLKQAAGYQNADSGAFSARRRHLDALERAGHHVHVAQAHLLERRAGELVAEELRLAQQALGEITGAVTSDDLLGKIFSTFCIGK
jgi:tRNA modification GTPase